MADSTAVKTEQSQEKTTTEFDGSTEVEITTNWDEITSTFDSMDLKELLLRGIFAYGFEKPSAIQQRAIKPMITGRDIIAQAQSGLFLKSLYQLY